MTFPAPACFTGSHISMIFGSRLDSSSASANRRMLGPNWWPKALEIWPAHLGEIYDVQSGTVYATLLKGGLAIWWLSQQPFDAAWNKNISAAKSTLMQACICGADSPARRRPSMATMAWHHAGVCNADIHCVHLHEQQHENTNRNHAKRKTASPFCSCWPGLKSKAAGPKSKEVRDAPKLATRPRPCRPRSQTRCAWTSYTAQCSCCSSHWMLSC